MAEKPMTLAAALAAAQSEFPDIPRSKTVTVKTQSGSYEFSYSPLDAIIKATRPALSKNGLAVTQLLNRAEQGCSVVTRLLHAGSDATLEAATPVIQTGTGAQAFGSAVTYARRYAYCAILCIQAEDDDDANVSEGNAVQPHQPMQATVAAAKARVATPAAPAAAAGTVTVTPKSITEKPTRTGGTFYQVTLADGRKASTFNSDYAGVIAQSIGRPLAVILSTSADGKFLNIAVPEVEKEPPLEEGPHNELSDLFPGAP